MITNRNVIRVCNIGIRDTFVILTSSALRSSKYAYNICTYSVHILRRKYMHICFIYCLLPLASCLLPLASCPLPIVHCPLSDEWNSQTRDEITDIERASEARARLEESRALIAHHRPRVTAPRTYAGQDQIQHGARQRMHASRLHSRELMANLATMRGDVGTAGCGRAVTRGLLLR